VLIELVLSLHFWHTSFLGSSHFDCTKRWWINIVVFLDVATRSDDEPPDKSFDGKEEDDDLIKILAMAPLLTP
jgi:hypothetical protein